MDSDSVSPPPQAHTALQCPVRCTACCRTVCRSGSIIDVQNSLNKCETIDCVDENGRTPLSWASARTDDDAHAIVRLLLERGASVHTVDKNKRTPIMHAAAFAAAPIVAALLDAGADATELATFVRCHNWGRKYTLEELTPLGIAVSNSNWSAAIEFLRRGYFDESKSSVSFAVSHCDGEPAAVRALLADGMDANAESEVDNTSLLMCALQSGYWEIARLLCVHGGRCQGHERPVAYVCRRAAHVAVPILEFLYASGNASVEELDEHGLSPLAYASQRGDVDVVRWLVAHGANVRQRISCEGAEPEHVLSYAWVACHCRWEIFEILLRAGAEADVNVRFSRHDQRTLLMLAALSADADAVALLVEMGADVNLRSASGSTALHYWSYNKLDFCCLEKLLRAGADVSVRNDQKETFYDTFVRINDQSYHCMDAKWRAVKIVVRKLSLTDLTRDDEVELVSALARLSNMNNIWELCLWRFTPFRMQNVMRFPRFGPRTARIFHSLLRRGVRDGRVNDACDGIYKVFGSQYGKKEICVLMLYGLNPHVLWNDPRYVGFTRDGSLRLAFSIVRRLLLLLDSAAPRSAPLVDFFVLARIAWYVWFAENSILCEVFEFIESYESVESRFLELNRSLEESCRWFLQFTDIVPLFAFCKRQPLSRISSENDLLLYKKYIA